MTMTRMAAFGIGVAMALAAVAPTTAQRRAPAAPMAARASGPLAMDVAGVRLGMRVDEAERALTGSYRCNRFGLANSFDEMVQDEVSRRQRGSSPLRFTGSAPMSLMCQGPSGERLTAALVQTGRGSIVGGIDLVMDTTRVDAAAVERQVAAKYGRPSQGSQMNGKWCAGSCIGSGATFAIVSGGGEITMLVNRGFAARKAEDAAVKAAADRIAPASQRGAF